ncbi:hypothetical protein K435DRAFT_776950 [Dendrothele bispora CBS 962.96]|uniref:DUF6699 domain-containing protein n=1 Tax=Dendrothele bispora (strain CBS 962.96) TaxID=1314807 RepID=A0A4S8MAV6_DENBC|nr:hypothetical protein K435DRAFT_776950 [Dendrothele bispora CBS 962.96]
MSPNTKPAASPRHLSSQRAQHRPRHPPIIPGYQHHFPSRYPSSITPSSEAHTVSRQSSSGAVEPRAPHSTTTQSPLPVWSVRTDQGPTLSRQLSHVVNAPHRCTTVPLPPQVSDDVDVIPLLKSCSDLVVDLRMSSIALRQHARDHGWDNWLGEPATCPPIPSITVVHPVLPWMIMVHRSRYEWVTVSEVLSSILQTMQEPVGPEFVDETRHLDGARTKLDYLPGTRLAGLRKSRRGEDVWIMDVI